MTYSSKFSYSDKQIFRLRLYYGILVKLLDTHLGGTHVLISEDINRIYLQLCIKIEELLKESIFKKLPKKHWKPFSNLLTANSDYDIDWEIEKRQQCYDFKSYIEELFIRNGEKEYGIEPNDVKLLIPIKKFIEDYQKDKDQKQFDETMSVLTPIAKAVNWLSSGKNQSEKIYDTNTQYEIYKDIKEKMKSAKSEVFLVEPYPEDSLFELYLDPIPNSVKIMILTKKPSNKFLKIATMFANKRNLVVKESDKVHDRYLFVDDNAWMIGASIKDAGKKPTSMIQVKTKDLYKIWKSYFDEGIELL